MQVAIAANAPRLVYHTDPREYEGDDAIDIALDALLAPRGASGRYALEAHRLQSRPAVQLGGKSDRFAFPFVI